MERLTLKTIENIISVEKTSIEIFEKHGECCSLDKCILRGMEELKQYRIAEEQGFLLRLPCKVGGILWWVDAYGDLRSSEVNSMFIEQGIDGIVIETLICNINAREIGKTVFFTKEEAEEALAKMERT